MMDRINLQGRLALITGGSSGIGWSIAKEFAKAGMIVLIFGQNEERGRAREKELKEYSEKNAFFSVDVSSYDQVKKVSAQILSEYGAPYALINNAGITRDKLLLRMKEEDFDDVIKTNLKSCFNLCSHFCPPMMKKREGSIINISSVVGVFGNAGQLNYASSKAGMIGFTKSLAKEIAARNIRVNAIAPGYIDTAMTDSLDPKQKEAMEERISLGRMGRPEEIAGAALFLASELSSYVTGQVLIVDGGMAL